MKRAAIWRAVSSKEQMKDEKSSLDSQLENGRAAAKELGAVVVHDLCVPGQSRSIESLEEAARQISAYAELIELCKTKQIDLLITDRADRLGRDLVLVIQVYRLCSRSNVSVYDIAARHTVRPNDNSITAMFQAYSSELAVKTTSRNNLAGRTAAAKMGRFVGKLPFGYKWAYSAAGSRTAIIHEASAAVVREAVELYLSGRGGRSIARILNSKGYQRNNRPWDMGHIYKITAIIDVYGGKVHWRGQMYDGKHEPIIDAETVRRVVAEKKARAINRNYGRPAHLFSRMIECADCGYNMVVKKYAIKSGEVRTSYRCRFCHRTIAESVVVEEFIQAMREIVRGKEIDYVSADQSAIDERNALELELSEIRESLERLDARYVAGRLTEERYDAQLEPLEKRQSEITEKLSEAAPEPPVYVDLDDDIAELLIDEIRTGNPAETNAVIRSVMHILFNPKSRTLKFVRKS